MHRIETLYGHYTYSSYFFQAVRKEFKGCQALRQPLLYLLDIHIAGFRAVARADEVGGFHEVEQACGAGVADFEAALEQ